MSTLFRLGLSTLVIAALAGGLMVPKSPLAEPIALTTQAPTLTAARQTDATDQVLVKYRAAPQGAQAGAISAVRLDALRTVGRRFDVAIDYSRTMAIGSYVLKLGRTLAGPALDQLVQALRSSDPGIEWVVPDSDLTAASEVLTSDEKLAAQWNLKDGPGGIRALDAWDEQWQFAASEGKPGFVPDNGTGPRLVRYGQYNGSWYYKEISGDFTCSPSTFGGDPNPGIVKRCEVASYWVKAADEGQPITLARGVSKWVRYGWGDNWYYAKITDHGVCSPSQFGGDPARFVTKICQVELRTDGGGVVAGEGDTFTLPRPGTVRYGVMGKWTYRQVWGGAQATCSPAFFGSDPAPWYVKHCEVVRSQGFGVTIAVPDRGLVPHPDLDNKLVPGYNFVDRNADTRDLGSASAACGNRPDASNWHGLKVASVAGAQTNNGIGIAAVAPQANISMSKVATCSGTSLADVLDGVAWSAGIPVPGAPPNLNPARVINLSMTASTQGAPCSQAWQDTIDKVRARGSILVVAAGNSSRNLSDLNIEPTNCRNVIVVAATDSTGAKWSGSNYGQSVALSAPGQNVYVLSNDGSTLPGAPTAAMESGTSFAAAHVAGVAALVLGKNPQLTPTNVENRLMLSAQPFAAPCSGCGRGIVDAAAAEHSAEAIATESGFNDYDANADNIIAPADVVGNYDSLGKHDVFSIDLLPGAVLTASVLTEAPGSDCHVQYGVYPYSFECSKLEQGYQNSTTKTQRLFIHISTTVNTSVGRPYTLLASWTQPR